MNYKIICIYYTTVFVVNNNFFYNIVGAKHE